MTTLLDTTRLPLWVYIVLIVVGSLLLLLSVALVLRWWLLRRRVGVPEYDGLTGPTRRMTVRRGRMVPTSQHLSLTGSRFGMRQFGILADNDSTLTGRRSPFEWWNTMLDRSQSRQDQMSQVETGSIYTRPSSRATTLAGRREFLTGTPTRTPEKIKEPVLRTTEIIIPPPSPSPTPSMQRPPINFSRSFIPKGPSSPLTQRSQYTLSRIEESSPHTSMMGNPSRKSNRSSYFAAIHPQDHTPLPGPVTDTRSVATTTLKSTIVSVTDNNVPTPKKSNTFARGPGSPKSFFLPSPKLDSQRFSASATLKSQRKGDFAGNVDAPRPKTADAATSSRRNQAQFAGQPPALPSTPTNLTFPKPTAQQTPLQYEPPYPSPLYLQQALPQSSRSKRASTASRRDSLRESTSLPASRKSSMSIGPSGIVYESQLPNYWSSRSDLQDLSKTLTVKGMSSQDGAGGKGKRNGANGNDDGERENIIGVVTVPGKNNTRVLRKKSLRRLQKTSPN